MEKVKGELKDAHREIEKKDDALEGNQREIQLLKEKVACLEASLKNKDAIIELLKERR